MYRKHTPKSRRNRTTSAVPGIEKLESRQLMAGDGLPLISVSAPTQVSRTSDADFWIRLDRPVAAGEKLEVKYTTRAIGATANRDFQSTTATALFVEGESSKVINIATLPLPAAAAKSAKPATFALDITSASSGKIVQKTAVTNIVREAAGFQIDISFSGNVSDKTKVAAREAADKWQNVITGDLPAVVVDGEYIDDFKLVVREEAVDGLNSALAYASPTRTYSNGQQLIQKRGSSNTSYGGTAVVDIADRDNEQIKDIMVHELGHALGVGPFWTLEYIRSSFKPLGLVKNLFTDSPIYVGRYALAEYRKLAPGAIGVPLESGGGGGTRAAHWSEAVFGNEPSHARGASGSRVFRQLRQGRSFYPAEAHRCRRGAVDLQRAVDAACRFSPLARDEPRRQFDDDRLWGDVGRWFDDDHRDGDDPANGDSEPPRHRDAAVRHRPAGAGPGDVDGADHAPAVAGGQIWSLRELIAGD